MRKFNKNIEVSFSIDAIAEMIKDQLKDTFLHADLVVEAIIAPMVVNGNYSDKVRLGKLVSALCGRSSEINISVGAVLNCTHGHYSYDENGKEHHMPLGKVKVLQVEPFRDHGTVQVEYQEINRRGELITSTDWVNVSELEDWIEPLFEGLTEEERRDDVMISAHEDNQQNPF
jgi:hypothetical protein